MRLSRLCALAFSAHLVLSNLTLASESPAGRRFALVKTSGQRVCRAFLHLLNDTTFEKPPACGISIVTSAAGFSQLEKTLLPEEQAEKLFPRVFGFVTFHDQSSFPATPPPSVIRSGYGSNIFAWKYPSMSVGNDGIQQDVLLWQGQGVDQFIGDTPCGGSTLVHTRYATYLAKQFGFILSSDGQSIDESKTNSVFGHLEGHIGELARAQHRMEFNEVGYAVGLFQFESRNYIYAFYEHGVGDVYGKRNGNKSLDRTIAVLYRHENKTQEECAILDREQDRERRSKPRKRSP